MEEMTFVCKWSNSSYPSVCVVKETGNISSFKDFMVIETDSTRACQPALNLFPEDEL